jgi:uncharacterized protein (TIGR01244 family)
VIPILLFTLLFSPQDPVKETLPGAANVTRVDAVVMCGGATTTAAIPELKTRGFASIVNLRREQEPGADIAAARSAAASAGLKYIHIPVDGANPDPAAADTFIRAVTDKTNQPVYIHCASANRVGAMWLIKRVVADGWELPRALKEAEAIGLTNENLKKFAIDYATSHRK